MVNAVLCRVRLVLWGGVEHEVGVGWVWSALRVGIWVVLVRLVGHSYTHIYRQIYKHKISEYKAQVHTLLGPPLSIGK